MIDGGALVIVFLRLHLKSVPIRSSTHLAALATDKTNYFNTVKTNRRRIRPNPHSLNLIPFHSAHTTRRLQLGLSLDYHQALCMSSIFPCLQSVWSLVRENWNCRLLEKLDQRHARCRTGVHLCLETGKARYGTSSKSQPIPHKTTSTR